MIFKNLLPILILTVLITKVSTTDDEDSALFILIGFKVEEGSSAADTNKTLLEGLSLNDKLRKWSNINPNPIRQLNDDDFLEAPCEDADRTQKIFEAILKTIDFYEKHLEKFPVVDFDTPVGLQVLHGLLKQRGVHFDVSNRIAPLVKRILERSLSFIGDERIKDEIQEMVSHEDLWDNPIIWKSPKVLKSFAGPGIGDGVEVIWGPLNRECQFALVNRCEVPYLCARAFLDEEPQSQYMLTHQALYLLFAKKRSCDSIHPQHFINLEARLANQCAKMFQEADLIAQNGFPTWSRDLFAEYLFICGQAGYSNFLRKDWVDEVLSWQSTTSGCTVNNELNVNYVHTDHGAEIATGAQQEVCFLHHTTTALSTLAVQWAWNHDNMEKCNS